MFSVINRQAGNNTKNEHFTKRQNINNIMEIKHSEHFEHFQTFLKCSQNTILNILNIYPKGMFNVQMFQKQEGEQ